MDMTRVSACSYPLRDEPLAYSLDVIAAAGFKRVDLLGRMPHLSLDPAECDPATVKAEAALRGLQIANLGTYPGKRFCDQDPAWQEQELAQVKRAIDIAELVGARSIRVTAGDDKPESMDQLAQWFRQCADYAGQRGVYLGIETHGGGINGRPDLLAELAARVGSPYFGALYDPCNLMQYGLDYRMALWTLRNCIVHVHFKDAAVTGAGFERMMLGEGQIDFTWCIERLDALGYRGDWALEYELTTEPPETGLKKWYAAATAL